MTFSLYNHTLATISYISCFFQTAQSLSEAGISKARCALSHNESFEYEINTFSKQRDSTEIPYFPPTFYCESGTGYILDKAQRVSQLAH